MQNNIKRLRLQADLSQQSLADKVGGGATKSTIQKLEKGSMSLTTEWMAKIAKALNLSSPCELIDDGYTQAKADGSDEALMYAVKEIIKLLLDKRQPITREKIRRDFIHALDSFQTARLPGAVAVMDELLEYVEGKPHQEIAPIVRKPLRLVPPG